MWRAQSLGCLLKKGEILAWGAPWAGGGVAYESQVVAMVGGVGKVKVMESMMELMESMVKLMESEVELMESMRSVGVRAEKRGGWRCGVWRVAWQGLAFPGGNPRSTQMYTF